MNSLINNSTRTWNSTLVREMFSEEDGSIILAIPLPRIPSHDRWIWHHFVTTNSQLNRHIMLVPLILPVARPVVLQTRFGRNFGSSKSLHVFFTFSGGVIPILSPPRKTSRNVEFLLISLVAFAMNQLALHFTFFPLSFYPRCLDFLWNSSVDHGLSVAFCLLLVS